MSEEVYKAPAATYLIKQSRLPELTENYILDEPTRNKSLLHEHCDATGICFSECFVH